MNETAKWMMAGMFLLPFHIDLMGMPIVPGIVGCLVPCSGFRTLEREGGREGFEWNRKMEQAGRLWLNITILDLILAVFTRRSTRISIQITAVLMLTETVCGCSTLNYYGEPGRQYTQNCKKGPSPLGYFIWMTAGLAFYEYSAILGSSGWNTAGAVCIIIGRIMLAEGPAVWVPGEKTEY